MKYIILLNNFRFILNKTPCFLLLLPDNMNNTGIIPDMFK
jgi:hypothetical protein